MSLHYIEEEEFSSKVDLALWKRIFDFTKPYKKSVIVLVILAICIAICDAGFAQITRYMIDAVNEKREQASLWPWITLYVMNIGLLCLGIAFFIRKAGFLSTQLSHDIRQAGFWRLQELSFSYLDRKPVGWLMARLTSDCEKLSNIIAWGIVDIVWGFMLTLVISVALLVMNVKVGCIVLLVLPLLILISSFFQRLILKSSRNVSKTNSMLTASYNEGLMGLKTTRVLGREEKNLEEFQGLTGNMYQHSMRNLLQSAVYLPLISLLAGTGIGLALWRGGAEVLSQSMTIGEMVAFMSYMGLFFDPIQQIAHRFAELQAAQSRAERIVGLIDTQPEIVDSPGALEPVSGEIGKISFQNVCFTYQQGKSVLKDFNLDVMAGQTVALVGATGGGKSTIVNLLCRFYEPTSGRILFDQLDYRKIKLHWLHSRLGIVLQHPHLFSGSIEENIRYGNLEASFEEIELAAQRVYAHEFIMNLPDGYQTRVGEGGSRLSSGEKQLVSFARAVLADPLLFIMDEATASVDTYTERLIQRGLSVVLEKRTSFIIAHRLSTIRSADVIVVIEQGNIIEQGKHAELMRLRGKYYALIQGADLQ